MSEDPRYPFLYTHYKAKKAVEREAGTSIPQGSPTNVDSTMSAPGSGTPTTGQPAHLKDIPIGLRYGYIDKIDYSRPDAYIYHVIFEDKKTEIWARKIGDFSIKSIPEYTTNQKITTLNEVVWVGLVVEYGRLTWGIIGELESDYAPESGTWNLIRGNTKLIIHEDSIKIGYNNSYIEIEENEINITSPTVKINGKVI